MNDNDPVNKALDRWKSEFRPDPDLAALVRSDIRRSGGYEGHRPATVSVWIGNAFSRPGLAVCFAAVFMLVGMGVSQLLTQGMRRGGDEMTLSYRLSIDPLYRLQAMAGAEEFANRDLAPASPGSDGAPVLLAGLGWLQGELDLTQTQLARVTRLHGEYESAFDELFAELLESHRAYREFDRRRMEDDVIDYFELYDLLQTQKQLSERSAQLTSDLLTKVESVINPSQRIRYRELLDSIYPEFSNGGLRTTDV